MHPQSYIHNDAPVTFSGGGLVYATRAKFGTVEFRGRNIRILEDDFGYTYSSAVELKNGNTKWSRIVVGSLCRHPHEGSKALHEMRVP